MIRSLRQVAVQARRPIIAAVLVFVLATVEALPARAQDALGLEPILSGLGTPTDIVAPGDGSGRLFVVEQNGVITIVQGDLVLPDPFLDIRALVSAGGERGLLGLAFHPGYAANGQFYVNYTATGGDTVIARYLVSADPNRADAASAQTILGVAQPFGNHNGGQLRFGPDGMLYIGLGDGGGAGDPFDNGQDLGTLLGKLLRIDVDGGAPYAVPGDNPFVGTPGARAEVWAYGLRNPWRFSFDRLTGDLFIADVGQNTREEVDVQPADSPGGENYGWNLMEGSLCFDPPTGCNVGSLVLPAIEYQLTGGNCAIIGGHVYRGMRFPQLRGIYLFGDHCSGRIWGSRRDGADGWQTVQLASTGGSISTFGEDQDGEVYVGVSGTVARIVARFPACEVGMRQSVFTTGEPIVVETWRVSNIGPFAVGAELRAWIRGPDGQLTPVARLGEDGTLTLPPGFDQALGPRALNTASMTTPRGAYTFSCALIDPVSGERLALGEAAFEVE